MNAQIRCNRGVTIDFDAHLIVRQILRFQRREEFPQEWFLSAGIQSGGDDLDGLHSWPFLGSNFVDTHEMHDPCQLRKPFNTKHLRPSTIYKSPEMANLIAVFGNCAHNHQMWQLVQGAAMILPSKLEVPDG